MTPFIALYYYYSSGTWAIRVILLLVVIVIRIVIWANKSSKKPTNTYTPPPPNNPYGQNNPYDQNMGFNPGQTQNNPYNPNQPFPQANNPFNPNPPMIPQNPYLQNNPYQQNQNPSNYDQFVPPPQNLTQDPFAEYSGANKSNDTPGFYCMFCGKKFSSVEALQRDTCFKHPDSEKGLQKHLLYTGTGRPNVGY